MKKEYLATNESEKESEKNTDTPCEDSEVNLESSEKNFISDFMLSLPSNRDVARKYYFSSIKAMNLADFEVQTPPPKA